MSVDPRWRTVRKAVELAALLRAARVYVATARPHVCSECGHLFALPILMGGRHCARCCTTRPRKDGS